MCCASITLLCKIRIAGKVLGKVDGKCRSRHEVLPMSSAYEHANIFQYSANAVLLTSHEVKKKITKDNARWGWWHVDVAPRKDKEAHKESVCRNKMTV